MVTPWPQMTRPIRWPAWLQKLDGARHAGQPDASDHVAMLDPNRQASLNRRLLYLLVVARLVVFACGLLVVSALSQLTDRSFPLLQMTAALVAVTALSFLALYRMRQHTRADENEFMLHISGDVLLLTYVLAETGGPHNPFFDFYLLPLALSAYALSWWRVVIVMALVVVGWMSMDAAHLDIYEFPASVEVTAHFLTAALIAYFAYAVATISRNHERMVARGRERAITARSAEAIGTVAAKAAHAMSTPLGTMAVLVAELRQKRLTAGDRNDALETLACQINACKQSLSDLLGSVGVTRGDTGGRIGLDRLLQGVREECELMDPAAAVTLKLLNPSLVPEVVVERSLFDALILLLKDCVREPPHTAHVSADWDADRILIRMTASRQHSKGSRGTWIAPLNGPTVTTGTEAMERLTLASAMLERFDGHVEHRIGGDGITLEVSLPLKQESNSDYAI